MPARRVDLLLNFWLFVTDLGDSAVTLPLGALALLYLLLSRWPRAAVALAISLAAGGTAIAALKLALQSCGERLLQTTMIDPSGHVAMSTMIYGALAFLALEELLSQLTEHWPVLFGVLLILIVLYARGGIDSLLGKRSISHG